MEIHPIQDAEIEQARLLLVANGWGPRVADAAVFETLVSRSQVKLVAVQGGAVVGFLDVCRTVAQPGRKRMARSKSRSSSTGKYFMDVFVYPAPFRFTNLREVD